MTNLVPQIADGDLVYPAEVSGHVRSGNSQFINGATTYGTFDVQANITENLWESVGPTGSSATNIWTAMDDIPDEATMLLGQCYLATSPAAVGEAFIIAYIAQNGITPVLSLAATEIARLYAATTAATLTHAISVPFQVPLDGSLRFQASWDEANSNTDERIVRLYYRGFRSD